MAPFPRKFLPQKSSPTDSEKGKNGCDMSTNDSTAKRAAQKLMPAKKRAPGWQIRCLKCDFAEPWSKHGIGRKATKPMYVSGRCPQCKRIRFRVIEKVPTAQF
jgi:Zn finger protein HypA/HybF involved in hydrogenase expression